MQVGLAEFKNFKIQLMSEIRVKNEIDIYFDKWTSTVSSMDYGDAKKKGNKHLRIQ